MLQNPECLWCPGLPQRARTEMPNVDGSFRWRVFCEDLPDGCFPWLETVVLGARVQRYFGVAGGPEQAGTVDRRLELGQKEQTMGS